MRKHHIPLGWPQRDSRHYRFPLPNAVWEYELKPIEFVILSCLCLYHSHSQSDKEVSVEAVSKDTHMTVATAKKYLDELVSKRLITDKWFLSPNLQHNNHKNFFTLPNEIFLLSLPPSAFVVYAYLLLIENRRAHTCHPSYNTIATEAGMAKRTAIKSISVLLEKGLIAMEHSHYFDQRGMKWNGNNLYTLKPISQVLKEREGELLAEMKRTTAQRKWDEKYRPDASVPQR